MSGLTLHCPKCQAPLKLKDRQLLGKVGKCPKCSHKFVLQEQDEVALELVEPTGPQEGKNATWIPDTATPQSLQPQTTQPVQSQPQQPAPAAADPLSFLKSDPTPPPGSQELPFLSASDSAASSTAAAVQGSGLEGLGGLGSSSSSPPIRKRRRRRRSSGGMIAVVALLCAAGMGGYLYYQSTLPPAAPTSTASSSNPAAPAATPAGSGSAPAEVLPAKTVGEYNPIKAQSPTSGSPIQLLNMPAGVRVVINLRPAQLWGTDRQATEFRASLGPLGTWLESQIQTLTRQPPAQIEELMIGILLGARGTQPELAAVVHLKEPQQRADLLTTYNGRSHNEFSTDIKIGENGQAYRILDDRTIAICPEMYVEDLKTFEDSPAMTADHLHEILKATDRDRLATIVFDPSDLEIHKQALFPAAAQLVAEKTLRWLGDDVWAAAWSLHLQDDFHSELVVRGQNTVGTATLKKLYQDRLHVLPEILLTSVQKMNPQHSGYRQIIGRFPAMLKVLAMTTAVGIDGRFVRMGTLLPPKAGPNLALGTLLTWDESTRTDFSTPSQAVAQTPQRVDRAQLPFAERLQVKMDIDFRRTPLQEAFAFISDEAKIPIEINGDALKLAGFTQNMPQTINLEGATTLQALYSIIKNYENEAVPMAIHMDEAKNLITVMTSKFAEDQGLDVYDFKKNGVQ